MRNENYTARVVLTFIQIIGWMVVFLGLGLVAYALSGPRSAAELGLLGVGLIPPGLLLIALAQIGMAVVSTAMSTAEMVELLHEERKERRAAARAQGGAEPGAIRSEPPKPDAVSLVENYRSRGIYKTRDGFRTGNSDFDSVSEARLHIDQLLRR